MLLVWKRCFVVSGFCVANASSLQRSLMVVRCAKAKSKWFKRYSFCIDLPIMVNQQGQVDHMAKDLAGFVKGLGYKTIEFHKVYIHRSLTREIMVYEKT
jgi:predicted RNase H-related nuclease YkuK (DUF458 family)